MPDELFENAICSHKPCPSCVQAAQQAPMTFEDWQSSEYGLPGSSGRFCEDDCHCLLVPAGTVTEGDLGEGALRGDPDSDIGKIVDIGPNEQSLQELMDEWNQTRGKLPPAIYKMPLEDVIPFLRKLLGKADG